MAFLNLTKIGDLPAIPIFGDDAPQDPFYPVNIPSGPAFLDTEACLCAYRQSPVAGTDEAAWECVGNQFQQDITETVTGKWFRASQNATTTSTSSPLWDPSNPPDTTGALMYDESSNELIPFNPAAHSPWDNACTGLNQTIFSTAFYRAVHEKQTNQPMLSALPCYRGTTALPMQIMNLTTWQDTGCPPGYLCANNTVNSLPQYCPPVEACQTARMLGMVCQFQRQNIGMGPFEPVICQSRYYCPVGGRDKIRCPRGHYCPPGSVEPRRCGVGMVCHEGSIAPVSWVPLVCLAIFDALLVLGVIAGPLRRWWKRRAAVKMLLYGSLGEDSDPECSILGTEAPQYNTFTSGRIRSTEANGTTTPSNDNSDDQWLSPQLRAFVESMRKATETARFGLSFQYTNLSYHPSGAPRPILHNVTGCIERGTLTAVMGGSGAGKSTFMSVLMGKQANTAGAVMVNDVPNKIKTYKKLIGYVPQDDIVLPELTVRESILHSARIRLLRTWTDAEIQAHVDTVIDCLELAHVQHSLVGTVGRPLISGGQRKRVSIGMELAAAPMAIFLDEPTSGLDATAASSIIRTLKSIAGLGISVIVTIHQPRPEIMGMLDELILLAEGQVVCQGHESYIQQYLESLEFTFPPYANTGDVITDIITGNGSKYKNQGPIATDWLVTQWACFQQDTQTTSRRPVSRASSSTTISSSPAPNRFSLMRLARNGSYRLTGQQSLHDPAILDALAKRGASRPTQTLLCLHRALVQQYRQKSSFAAEMFLASLAAFLLGLSQHSKNGVLFRGLYKAPFAIISPAVDVSSAPEFSLLLGVSIGLIAASPGVRVFSEEILLQRREAEAGHSRLAYFLAKTLSPVPRMLIACAHFTVVVLFLSKLTIPWWLAFAANLLYFWCIYGLAAVVSMLARREDAPLLATMVSLVLGILCGAAPSLAQVAKWRLEWLWRMSPGVWLTELYFGELVRPFEEVYQTEVAAAAMGLVLRGTGRSLGVLVAIGVILRVIAFVGLVRGKRLRI